MGKDVACETRVVLYEDDKGLAEEIVIAFAARGRSVIIAETDRDILDAVLRLRCVLIMDRIVRDVDSLSIVKRLREGSHNTPVLVISSLVSVDERIKGLIAGGDDYLIKPFAMDELVARVDVMIRRSAEEPLTKLIRGDLTMNLIDRSVERGTRPIPILPREFQLLEFFMRNPEQLITRTMILEKVWGLRAQIQTNVVDVHVGNLRRKINGAGELKLIVNKRGAGFIFSPAKDGSVDDRERDAAPLDRID